MGTLIGNGRLLTLIGSLLTVIVSPALLLAAAPESDPRAKAQATREIVQEALQREVYGLTADREQLLLAAAKADPAAELPRWYLGQLRNADGTWYPASKLPSAGAAKFVREYQALRETKIDDAAGNLALANWCDRHDLPQQLRAHLLRSLELNANQPEVRQRLGLVRIGNQWIERTILAREQQRQQTAREAFEKWKPIIIKLAPQLLSPDKEKREAALDQVRAITDAGALPALQSILAPRGEEQQLLVLEVCGKFSDPAVTELIASQAFASPSLRVRQTAADMLKTRDQAAFVPALIAEMYAPVVARTEAISLPGGGIGLRQAFWREGAEHHDVRILDTAFQRVARPGGDVLETQSRAVRAAEVAAVQTEQAVAEQNRLATELNDRLAWVLSTSTGEQLPAQPQAWWKWWTDRNEIFVPEGKSVARTYQTNRVAIYDRNLQQERETAQRQAEAAARAAEGPRVRWVVVNRRYDCLAAGTPVWTDQGSLPIEQLRVGDLVLARDVESGELMYQPILRTTVRPPEPLLRIEVAGETFNSSGGHPFWVSGQGWTKARDLQPGMILHCAASPVRVISVAEAAAEETYNLVVADFSTYFIGERMLLSHDNTVRGPTRAIVPGLLAD